VALRASIVVASLCLWLAAGGAPAATIADLTEESVTARNAARRSLLEGLKRSGTAYRFDFVVTYLPKGTIAGIDFDIPVTHIRYDSALFFDFDRDTLRGGADRIVRDFAGIIVRDEGLRSVLIVGHTDSVGPDAYNIDLAERRARTVYRRLKALGVDENVLGVVPMGEAQPLSTNASAEGRAANRRVEFFVSDVMEAALRVVASLEFDPCFRNDHGVADPGARLPCAEGGEQVRILLGPDAESRSPTRIIEVGNRSVIAAAPPESRTRPPLPLPDRQRPPLPVIRPSAE
jgi:outer membrane protein OmpA-like peptidoglycan-associated protein